MSNFILAMGGSDAASDLSTAVDVFEVKGNTVVKRTDLNLQLSEGRMSSGAASAGNFILCMGGFSPSISSKTVDVFEVKGDTVVKRTDLPLQLSQSRSTLSAASAGNFILAMGGFNVTSYTSPVVDVFEVKGDTVVKRDDISLARGFELSVPRYNLSAASAGNFILCMGGQSSASGGYVGTVDVFEVKGDTVVKRDDISLQLSEPQYSLCAASAGNFILAMGGQTGPSGGYIGPIDVFEVQGDTVVKRNGLNLQLSELRYNLSAASAGNFILAMGGTDEGEFYNIVDVFEVKGDTVVKRDDISLQLSQSRSSLSAASAGNFILAMGGQSSASGGYVGTVDVFEVVEE